MNKVTLMIVIRSHEGEGEKDTEPITIVFQGMSDIATINFVRDIRRVIGEWREIHAGNVKAAEKERLNCESSH